YIAMWAVVLWALDDGFTVFGQSGVCHIDPAVVLFYWSCAADSPLAVLAAVVNAAFTTTIWAPVFVAAATVDADAVVIAVPIVLAHLVGLPTALFVLIRTLLWLFAGLRLVLRRLWPRLRGAGEARGGRHSPGLAVAARLSAWLPAARPRCPLSGSLMPLAL